MFTARWTFARHCVRRPPMRGAPMTAAAFAASLGLLAVSHRGCGRLASRLRGLDRVTARRAPSSSFAPPPASSSSAGARRPAPLAPPCLDENSSLPSKVKVALLQLPVGEDKSLNIANARAAIEDAARDGAALVVLPEMWNCPYSNDSFPSYAEIIGPAPGRWTARDGTLAKEDDNEDGDEKSAPGDGVGSDAASVAMLSDAAAKLGVVVVGGSVPERCADTGALYNTCCVFDSDGSLLGKHRKTHLFDVDIPGEISFKESDTLSPGTELTVVDTAVGRLGIGICFDVRFPELAMACANRGAQIMVYPGAFNTVTGPLHWELLQRARAVDNQCFVLTCSPSRVPGAGYQAWGHSTAVGPWAEVIATTDEKPGTVHCELDMEQIRVRRRNMPLEKQRRGDVYELRDLGAVEKRRL